MCSPSCFAAVMHHNDVGALGAAAGASGSMGWCGGTGQQMLQAGQVGVWSPCLHATTISASSCSLSWGP